MKSFAIAAALLTVAGAAYAAEPMGEWLVADKSARIQIENCPTGLWGVVTWLKEPALDDNNPDKAKRTRSMIGVPILLAMKEVKPPGRWEGGVYNAKNGKIYDAHIALEDPNTLRIEGCVLKGMICSGESWTRVKAEEPAAPSNPRRPAPPPQPSVRDVCSGVNG